MICKDQNSRYITIYIFFCLLAFANKLFFLWKLFHNKCKSNLLLLLSFCWKGNGSPLQCSCLENPRDEGAWWAAVYGVAQSRTRLKRLSSSSSFCFIIIFSISFHLILWNKCFILTLVWFLRIKRHCNFVILMVTLTFF